MTATALAHLTTSPATSAYSHGVTCAVEYITPEAARQALDAHEQAEAYMGHALNRVLRPGRVARYAQMMLTGQWHLNGEPIQFSGTRLMNGQHRLRAIVSANVTVPMVVVRGIAPEAYTTLDQGMTRRLQDLLGHRGIPYLSLFSSAATMAWMYENHHTMFNSGVAVQYRSTPQGIAEYAEPNLPRWEVAVTAARRVYKLVARPAILAALYYLVAGTRESEVIQFIHNLETGENLTTNRAVYLLRERLMRERSAIAKTDTGTLAALVVKAWNAEISHAPMKSLKFRADAEVFPTILL